jgi:hypothetical protein
MIEIILTQGKTTLIDDIDNDLANLKWRARVSKRISSESWYAIRQSSRTDGKRKTIHLHRIILERKLGRSLNSNECVDHINNYSLDNSRKNVRLATQSENNQNSRARKGLKSSQYKGVYWFKSANKWVSQLYLKGRHVHLGLFDDEQDAAKAYNLAARSYFGDFAKLNKI